MIETIKIKNIASFDNVGLTISNLTYFNYFYGSNGSGKTTISRVIEEVENYNNCELKWKNNKKLKTLVYNRNFVNKTFNQSNEIQGIFTLGEDAANIEAEIIEHKTNVDKYTQEIANFKITLGTKQKENSVNEAEFEEKCWNLKRKYEDVFYSAFQGVLNSKNSFANKVKQQIVSNKSELLTFEKLKEKSATIFDKNISTIDTLPVLSFEKLENFENDKILETKIIGKEDINIAAMIKKLNNSDWVKQGKQYYDKNDTICPFCQQPTNLDFKNQLEEYFDETYINQLSKVKTLKSDYTNYIAGLLFIIEQILTKENKYLNKLKLDEFKQKIDIIFKSNLDKLSEKIEKPSNVLELNSLVLVFIEIVKYINEINLKIDEHNKTVLNINSERNKLISEIWKFITNEILIDYQSYKTKFDNISKAITGTNNAEKSKSEKIKELEGKIKELEGKTTSVIPTKNKINDILASYGFTNFELKESSKIGSYEIKRKNGEDAKKTLSEGEKSFITFLYFYQLINGSLDKETINVDKIVVFDDPVSSLDSNILFIISNLIRRIVDNIREGKGNIKQVFILTHNVYFHKEVSFDTKRSNTQKRNDENFWIIRKIGNLSTIKEYNYNPIKTSYELLWQEIKENENSKSITIHNTLRRILENYFMILGGFDKDKIISEFEGDDKIMCQSLMSWINDGSHFMNDDLFIDSSLDIVDKYLAIFKKIFVVTKHIEHYNMMMNKNC